MLTVIFIIAVIAAVAAFSVQNATPVSVAFLAWHCEASLALVVVLALLAGVLFGMVLMSLLRLRRSLRKRRQTAGADKTNDNTTRQL
jgi:uncharacterized integral membrane protein